MLAENLDPIGMLRQMTAKRALTPDDRTIIKKEATSTEQVDKLIEILCRKPVSSYDVFMEILSEERNDLYNRVKDIEAKHGYRKVKLDDGVNRLKADDLKIQRLLKKGGFGKVSLASHGHYGKVATKEFMSEISEDDIYHEANKMWRVISCPYLVRIIGFVNEPERKIIVMTYFPHGNLRDFNRKYLMCCKCWPRRIRMLQEITLGMNYIHTLDPHIIHSDLKMANVFVEEGFKVKIGDFGLAISTTSKTADDIRGTISHIPPEALNGTITKPDKLWDVFTYGISLYEFVSGQDAWKASMKSAIIMGQVLSGKRPNEAAIPKDVPQEILDIMKKCWDGNRDNRPHFHKIKKMISDVFEKQYEQFINVADVEINKLITPGMFSDTKPTETKLGQVSVTDVSARLSKDSGITSDQSIASSRSKSDVSVHKPARQGRDVVSGDKEARQLPQKNAIRSQPPTPFSGTRPKVANVAEEADLEKQAAGIAVTEAQGERKVHETKGEGLETSGGASVISGGASVLARVAALNLASTGTRDVSHKIPKTNTSISPTKPKQRKSDAAITGRIEEAGGGNKITPADSGTVGSDWSKSAEASNESDIGSQHSKEWKLMQTFGQEGDKDGEFRQADGIAVCKNGDIVVTNVNLAMQTSQAYMFNSNGTYKFKFQSHPTNPKGKLLYPMRVAVTPGGDVVISDQSNLVKIFSASGEYLKSLSTITAECDTTTTYGTMGVVISPSGVVYVGDILRQVITVHDMDRQQPIKKLSVHIKPYHLSLDPDNNIWVSHPLARQVIRYSDSGVELCRIKSFIVDNKAGAPRGAVYGKGSVYIVVIEVDEKTGKAFLDTGHMHQYTMDGQFQKCIIKGMYDPRGIAMSNGKLYVANTKSVLVYEQQ
ncbi:uncharacterized protein [Amphiura filiformis]|uniref:uncharacterized protein isoform X1 n=1 Tax=Amphiura filiformis TaxID=82378 RepID=UPI003B21F53A